MTWGATGVAGYPGYGERGLRPKQNLALRGRAGACGWALNDLWGKLLTLHGDYGMQSVF